MIELNKIQTELKAHKGQWNKFGKYNYRSCEDIMEALKPHLKETGCTLVIGDTMEAILDRVYVKATVTLTNKDGVSIVNTAFAREALNKKGMDESQITGACSSYARKYALNGLFLIDDTKDADSTNEHDKSTPVPKQAAPQQQQAKPPATLTEYLVACKINPVKALDNLKALDGFGAEQMTSVEQLTSEQQAYLNTNIDFFVNNCGV